MRSGRPAHAHTDPWHLPCSKHVFANKGIGGTSSGIFTACVEALVPPEADLVRGAQVAWRQAGRQQQLAQAAVARAVALMWTVLPWCCACLVCDALSCSSPPGTSRLLPA